jgi:hypothetical protein
MDMLTVDISDLPAAGIGSAVTSGAAVPKARCCPLTKSHPARKPWAMKSTRRAGGAGPVVEQYVTEPRNIKNHANAVGRICGHCIPPNNRKRSAQRWC